MSHQSATRRLSLPDLQAMKGREKIVSLTAYSAPMAALLDAAAELFIVGDSLGMVLYGMSSTLPVTTELMIHHARAVVSHSQRACVIVDLPFGSYQQSSAQAFETAARIMAQTGCQGVKLEGGMEMADTVRFLSERGIPVMAHIGLMPQHVHRLGGYKYQGRSEDEAASLREQADAMEQAGAMALLLEGIREALAREITQAVSVPTIGIGASPACDGQVLVTEDMLGLHERTPKFVKRYAKLRENITQAVASYAEDVKSGAFPALEHCFGTKNGKS